MTTPHRMVDGVKVPLTAAEIAERVKEEAEWAAKAPYREAEAIDRSCGMTRTQRDLAIAGLPAGHFVRTKAEEAEAKIVALSIRSVG